MKAVSRPRRLTTVAPDHLRLPGQKPAAAAAPTPVPPAVPAPLPEGRLARPPRPVVEAVQRELALFKVAGKCHHLLIIGEAGRRGRVGGRSESGKEDQGR